MIPHEITMNREPNNTRTEIYLVTLSAIIQLDGLARYIDVNPGINPSKPYSKSGKYDSSFIVFLLGDVGNA